MMQIILKNFNDVLICQKVDSNSANEYFLSDEFPQLHIWNDKWLLNILNDLLFIAVR